LLDAANTPFKDQAYARQQMLKYVKDQFKPEQRMAVFTLTTQLGVLQDFTSDPQILQRALEQYKPQEQELAKGAAIPLTGGSGDMGPAAAQLIAIATGEMRSFQNVQVAYVMDRRVESTLAALRSLARILGGIPGRKNVVWVTGAFPFSLIPEERTVSEAELAESLPSVRQLGVGTRSAGSVAGTERTAHAQEIREAAARFYGSGCPDSHVGYGCKPGNHARAGA
jgi:VWFA-related protein